MKNNPIIYFDVDGTLLDSQSHTILESTRQALLALKAKGYKLAVCTGRTFESIKEVGVLDLIDWDGYVVVNGAQVLNHKQETIYRKVFEPQWIKKLIENHPQSLLLQGDKLNLVHDANAAYSHSLEYFNIKEEIPPIKYSDEIVYKIISYGFDDLDNQTLEWIDTSADYVYDVLKNREISPKGTNKYTGVQYLNDYLDIDYSIGFGDGDNDIDFLNGMDMGIAMGNATPRVIEISDFQTASSWEDGIYKALVRLEIIEEIL